MKQVNILIMLIGIFFSPATPFSMKWTKAVFEDYKADYEISPWVEDIDEYVKQEQRERYQDTTIIDAIKYGALELVQHVIKENGEEINPTQKNKPNPLITAVHRKEFDIAKYLVKNRAELNIRDKNGETPLIEAIRYGNIKLIKYMLKKGAKANKKDRFGMTPLMTAISYKKWDIAKLLLKYKADLDKQDAYGRKSLIEIVRTKNLDLIKYFVENNPDVINRTHTINQEDQSGDTPLITAVQLNNYSIIKYLIGKNAYINQQNYRKESALSEAKKIGNKKIIKYLTKYGAFENRSSVPPIKVIVNQEINIHSISNLYVLNVASTPRKRKTGTVNKKKKQKPPKPFSTPHTPKTPRAKKWDWVKSRIYKSTPKNTASYSSQTIKDLEAELLRLINPNCVFKPNINKSKRSYNKPLITHNSKISKKSLCNKHLTERKKCHNMYLT